MGQHFRPPERGCISALLGAAPSCSLLSRSYRSDRRDYKIILQQGQQRFNRSEAFAVAETEEELLTERTDHHGNNAHGFYATASYNQNLDQSNRTRARSGTREESTTDKRHSFEISVRKQEMSHQAGQPEILP
jgi:hypothetical protein